MVVCADAVHRKPLQCCCSGAPPSTCQSSRLCLVFAGLAAQSVPLNLSEIAPVQSRGALNIMFQLSITVGILVAQLINLGEGSLPSTAQPHHTWELCAALFECKCCR